MKRSLLALCTFAACAALAVATHVRDGVEYVKAAVSDAWASSMRALHAVIEPALKLTQSNAVTPPAGRVYQMREYRERQMRREAPRIENTWRMCPST